MQEFSYKVTKALLNNLWSMVMKHTFCIWLFRTFISDMIDNIDQLGILDPWKIAATFSFFSLFFFLNLCISPKRSSYVWHFWTPSLIYEVNSSNSKLEKALNHLQLICNSTTCRKYCFYVGYLENSFAFFGLGWWLMYQQVSDMLIENVGVSTQLSIQLS